MIFTGGKKSKGFNIFWNSSLRSEILDSGLLHSCSIAEDGTIKMVPQSFISICSYELCDTE
jgi:hypothetical protein